MASLKGLGSHAPTISNTAGLVGGGVLASLAGTSQGLLMWLVLSTIGELVAPCPYKVVRHLAEETHTRDISVARNYQDLSILELKSNLQKQIFLSERICLAFTPRNRPRTGSP